MLEELLSLAGLRRIGRSMYGSIARTIAAASLVGCLSEDASDYVLDDNQDNDSAELFLPEPEVYTDYGIGVMLNGYSPNLKEIDAKYLAAAACLGLDEQQQRELIDKFRVTIITDEEGFPVTYKEKPIMARGLFNRNTHIISLIEGNNDPIYSFPMAHETVHAAGDILNTEYTYQECHPVDLTLQSISCEENNLVGKCGNIEDRRVEETWNTILTPFGIKVLTNEYSVNLNKIDEHYLETTSCMGYAPEEQEKRKGELIIVISTDESSFIAYGNPNAYYYYNFDSIFIYRRLSVTSHLEALSVGFIQALSGENYIEAIDPAIVSECGKAVDARLGSEEE